MDDEVTPDERAVLAPYFTTPDGPVFALVNLPEVVKGALFARYSRSPKSLRRLFLDEFLTPEQREKAAGHRDDVELGDAGTERAEQPYERVFVEYGDATADARALRDQVPSGPRGVGECLSHDHPCEGARHAARHAAGGDGLQRRDLRHGPGVRAAPAADARPSPRRGPLVRRPDAGRA